MLCRLSPAIENLSPWLKVGDNRLKLFTIDCRNAVIVTIVSVTFGSFAVVLDHQREVIRYCTKMAEKMQIARDQDEELFPYPGKVKSRVWEYFRFKKIREGPPTKTNLDMENAICILCKKTYTNNGKFRHSPPTR